MILFVKFQRKRRMSLSCSKEACDQPSTIYCYQCKQNLCFEHSKQHDENLKNQLYPLAFEMKNLSNRYATLNINELLTKSREKLNEWRIDSHKKIDEIYREKLSELDKDWSTKLTRPQKDLDRLRMKINEFNQRQKATHEDIKLFIEALQYVDQMIKDIETNGILIDVNEKSFADTKNKENPPINFENIYRSIKCSNQYETNLTNSKLNLLIGENHHLKLFDRNFLPVEQLPWSNGQIYDICWSNILNKFIFLSDKRIVYLLQEKPFSFSEVHSIEQENWWSCTTSDEFLFLSTYGTDPNIYQFNLKSSFDFVKRWRSPQTAHQTDFIHQINYSNQSLLLAIGNSKTKSTKIDLCSILTLNRLWSINLQMNFLSYQTNIRSIRFKHQQWLIFIENTNQIYHLTHDGTILNTYEYPQLISNITFFNNEFLIIRTDQMIYFHRI